MTHQKRIQFTRRELDMINDMAGIASAGMWGEGDYCGDTWESKSAKRVYDSLRAKVHALQARSQARAEMQRAKGAA